MLFRALDEALGSTAKVRILRALLPLTGPVSGTEAQALAGVRSDGGMWTALEELTALGLLERDETRRIHFFRINPDHDLIEPLTALFEAESKRIVGLRNALRDILDRGAVREHTLSIILFGSNARGDARPASDADLLVVADAESEVGRVERVIIDAEPEIRRRFGLRISPYVLHKARVEERYRDGDPLMQNIHSEGRTLYGTHFHEIAGVW
jgi:predicted nucleotidyltransferase